nr:Chain B, peptide AAAAAA [synthetic construct]4CIC_Q Chain Q, Hexa-alanine Peptide [synthetic construct]4NZ8_B Chain B, CLEAVED poly-Ala [Sus scrofa]4NZ8_C Chain C, CLEAVED poly-Ala [Sus scrofa]5WQL_F Chain F, ALA-ALA-ALA-ALA-ALA-ALA [Escherichia coli K-12]5WQL_H Chain H, ALA-ALA-ALA-ALA-ALA-ALA [Escherichia coli K-12]
AAAAAA